MRSGSAVKRLRGVLLAGVLAGAASGVMAADYFCTYTYNAIAKRVEGSCKGSRLPAPPLPSNESVLLVSGRAKTCTVEFDFDTVTKALLPSRRDCR